MNKKFFSLLLMGALTVATVGTVSSCKDYDDDINNLQEQIDKAALKTDVEALKTTLSNVQTTAATAQTTAESALAKAGTAASDIAAVKATAEDLGTKVADAVTKAENAQDAADRAQAAADEAKAAIEELDTQVQELAEAHKTFVTTTKLTEALNDLETKITEATDEKIDALKTLVNTFKAGINQLYAAVTGVELIGSWSNDGTFTTTYSTAYTTTFNPINITMECGKVADNFEFGKADKWSATSTDTYKADSGTVTYVKDTPFGFPSTELVVRVNPTNVKLDASMIKFFDSKGNDLDDVFEVSEVKAFDELLTTRGTGNATGLWKIKVDPKKDKDKTNTAVKSNDKKILYAVAVNNTAAQAEQFANAADRYVVSTYDVTFEAKAYEVAKALEKVQVKAASQAQWKDLENATVGSDNTPLIKVNNGENFQVSFKQADVNKAQYFYVVRDDYAAKNSGSSEYNAWQAYKYDGDFGKIIEVNQGEGIATLKVTIPEDQKKGDEIQFRVFAVNYDGSIVKYQDKAEYVYGKAFRVFVGADLTTAAVSGNMKATGYEAMATEWLPIDGTLTGNTTTLPATLDLKYADGKAATTVKVEYAEDAAGTKTATTSDKAKYVKFSATTATNLQAWTDGSEAIGTLENIVNGVTINSISVKLTKVMPTAADALALLKNGNTKFSWKAQQLVNNVYTAYLYPAKDDWKTAWNESQPINGYKQMTQAIDNLPTSGNAYLKIANAKLGTAVQGKQAYDADMEIAASANWQVDVPTAADDFGKKLIDNTTKHAAVFGYDFGKISSDAKNHADSYKVDATDTQFDFIFADPLAKTAQTYAWTKAAKPEVTYGEYQEKKATDFFTKIQGTNAFDNTVFGLKLKELLTGNDQKYVSASAKLYTKGTKIEQYFKASVDTGVLSFEPVSGATNPAGGDVASTLEVTLTDAFGETWVYEFDFTVKRAE